METPPSDELEPDKRLGMVEFYEKIFGWRVIDWDEEKRVWRIKTSATGRYNELGRSHISLNPNDAPQTGEENDFAGNVGAIEVDDLQAYTEKIREYGGQIDPSELIRIPDGSQILLGRDSTGRNFVLVELVD